MKKHFLALIVILFAGCSGDMSKTQGINTSVHASGPPCETELFYDGPRETADYLQFAAHACLITVEVKETYVLTLDHEVQAADLQMGSNGGSEFEWAFWVDFNLPNGRSFSLFNQYDKHQDVVGNRHEWRTFPVPLKLPAGTRITIRRPAYPDMCAQAGPIALGDGKGCATGQKVELVGTLR